MKTYFFIDTDTNEPFFVESESLEDAWFTIVDETYFVASQVNFIKVVSTEEAEEMGYDTY